MDWIRVVMSRCAALLRRKKLDDDLDVELRTHIDFAVAENMARGMSAEVARTEALREFGGVTQTRERYRMQRGLPFFEVLAQDVRFALRQLRKAPGFTLTAILTLALGIGANTAIFSVVNSVLLKPFGFRDPGRLVILRETMQEMAKLAPTLPDNPKHYFNLRAQSKTLENSAIFAPHGFSVAVGNDHPQIVNGLNVAPSFFSVLGVQPMLGRAFLPEEAITGHDGEVILTWEAWQRYFQGDPGAIGRTLRVGGEPKTVIGVMPRGFSFPSINMLPAAQQIEAPALEMFAPLPLDKHLLSDSGNFNYLVVARVRPGATVSQAQSELQGLQQAYVLAMHLQIHLGIAVIPLTQEVTGSVSTGLWLLLAAVAAVLLIACVNLANLQLARAVSREREASIRAALGASRKRLMQLALMESVVLAVLGGALGILLAFAGVRIFIAAAPAGLPRIHEVQVSWPVLLFALGLSVLTALLSGMLPALRSMRANPQSLMQGNSNRVANSRQGQQLRGVLVGAEVACTLLLLVVTALMVSSFARVVTQQRDFDASRVTLAAVNLYNPTYRQSDSKSDAAKTAFMDRALDGLAQIPGVTSAAVTSEMPLAGESWIDSLARPDHSVPEGQRPLVNVRMVSPNYRSTLEMPLLAGRDLELADRGHAGDALISAQTARAAWPGEDPIGKHFDCGDGAGIHTVVGVVADARVNDLKKTSNMVYMPYWENPRWSVVFLVRSSLPAAAIANSIRTAVWKVDPQVAIPTLKSLDSQVNDSVATDRFQTLLLSSFGAAALLLALLGVYGVLSYSVSLRLREFGIRVALGSDRARLTFLVLWQACYPVVGGILVGLGGSFVVTRWVRSLLYETQPADPLAISGSIVLLLAVATLAAMVPARRAASADPMKALRTE
jgi:predicted permease